MSSKDPSPTRPARIVVSEAARTGALDLIYINFNPPGRTVPLQAHAMPVLILELRLSLAIVNPAAIRVSHQEYPVVHVIGDSRKMHVIEAAGRLIAEDEVEIPSNHILRGC